MQTGGIINASRHAVRLRETACETLVQTHAAERLKRAAASHSRPATEALGLLVGDLAPITDVEQSGPITVECDS